MATLMAILAALPQLLSLISFFVDSIKKTPAEKRRDALIEFDNAIKLAKEKNNLTDLSKWFGKRL